MKSGAFLFFSNFQCGLCGKVHHRAAAEMRHHPPSRSRVRRTAGLTGRQGGETAWMMVGTGPAAHVRQKNALRPKTGTYPCRISCIRQPEQLAAKQASPWPHRKGPPFAMCQALVFRRMLTVYRLFGVYWHEKYPASITRGTWGNGIKTAILPSKALC